MTLADLLDDFYSDGIEHPRHKAHERYCAKTGSRMAFDTFSRRFREWRRTRPWIVEVEIPDKQWCSYRHEGVGEAQQAMRFAG